MHQTRRRGADRIRRAVPEIPRPPHLPRPPLDRHGSKAISGRAVDLLNAGARHRFFPELWTIRAQMTDRWGAEYGVKRDSIRHGDAGHGSGV
ncbi:hypothetical protein [Sphingopyxis sp.]|uniref:hypothetical protein n=1 Tax=Sphingopyxis sp. TaxID=1908224 RepID=UPI001D298B0B|nr:hypothetical protein [Sphingopyxis sp.]MBW8297449.1 hypothetical protein [Sphingopyxis sp.]